MATVIEKSSNVGASKISLMLDPRKLVNMQQRFGFGELTQSGLPGEVTGSLPQPRIWRDIERATLSYGYGLSVTTLQLARAYMILADGGKIKPVSIQLQTGEVEGQQVLKAGYAREIRKMLKSVVSKEGTAIKAAVPGYHVAGKTGTVKKVGKEGYSDNKYVAVFVGMAPADNPDLVMAITIHEPGGKEYYGGLVAAPVFSKVMAGALRLLDIAPDDLPEKQTSFAMLGGVQ
jgi:cell division protein FtsI (penicillin-binding protein 3)